MKSKTYLKFLGQEDLETELDNIIGPNMFLKDLEEIIDSFFFLL